MGYRRGGKEVTGTGAIDIDVWVHPSGKMIRRVMSNALDGGAGDVKDSTDDVKLKSPPERDREAPPPPPTPPRRKIPPTPEEMQQALDFLKKMRELNTQSTTLCNADPFDSARAANASFDFALANYNLRAHYTHVDLNAVMPDFWNLVVHEEQKNELARQPCCEKEPDNSRFFCERGDEGQ